MAVKPIPDGRPRTTPYLVVPAVAIGGVVTLGVAAAWLKLFPDLRKVDRMDTSGD